MALDLSKQVPRSPFEELDGFPWLPRMIDKARAYFAGTHGDYSPYPCPGDRIFLKFFGLDAKALGDLIQSGASDEAIAAYAKRETKRSPADFEAFRQSQRRPPNNPLLRFAFKMFIRRGLKRLGSKRPADPTKIDTIAKLLALEEGHPVPGLDS